MSATNDVIGAWYVFCEKCGGWTAFFACHSRQEDRVEVRSDNGEAVISMTWRELEHRWRNEQVAKGKNADFYKLDDAPAPCDCPKEAMR